MSSSSRRVVLVFASGALVALAPAAGCSSETTVTEVDAGDAGADASNEPDRIGPAEDTGAPLTEEQCLAACEAKHPAGLPKDQAIDTCWEQKCKGPCVDDTGVFDAGAREAGADGGDAGDGGAGTCKNEVSTGGDACDECTEASCCAEWDGCFDDAACAALNECRSACLEE